jgi:hypothetical protein
VAHILTRKYRSGSTRYTAVIRIRKGKCVVHREAKTFAHRAAALSWAKHREIALENPDTRAEAQHGAPTLAELIRWYIDTFETISKWQRSKQTHLEFLERHSIGNSNALALTVPTLIDHVRSAASRRCGTRHGRERFDVDRRGSACSQERQGSPRPAGRRTGGAYRLSGAAPHRQIK